MSKTYRTGEKAEVQALRGVSLSVGRGELVAVTGPSGSGKTTLLQCLSGLDAVDGGTVAVDGEDIHGMSGGERAALRAQKMGFVFQSLNLLPVFSAEENVELPLLIRGTSRAEARERAREALSRVGLSRRMGHRPAELSGGEQQRVAVARAFAARPALVWADEPTGSLDSAAAGGICDFFEGLVAGGSTLVLVTHDPTVAARAQRILAMRDGEISSDTGPHGPGPEEPTPREHLGEDPPVRSRTRARRAKKGR